MNQFTEEQVQDLAPDAASVKAALKVYGKANWEVFKSERAVWSSIKGSGSKPYLVRIDLSNTAFKCSCPSRKFPCKHGLSLAFYLARNEMDSISVAPEPIWVEEWIDKRVAKVAKTASKPKKVVSPEKVKKKSDDKWKDAVVNIFHLELWLKDFVNNGLIDLSAKSTVFFDNLIRRMVDFKMPGINTFLRTIQNVDYGQTGWEHKVLEQVHLLHLLVNSIKSHERLDPDYKKELELLLGWNIKKDELLLNPDTEIVDDVWKILSVIRKEDEGLTSRKTYLYGVTTNRFAYFLDFSFRGAGFSETYVKGHKMQAKLAMFPGVHKNRAVLKIKGSDTKAEFNLKPLSFKAANAQYLERRIKFPFTFDWLGLVASAKIAHHDDKIYLVNENDDILHCFEMATERFLSVLAITKGHWFDAFVVMNEQGVRLLAIYFNNKIYSL